MKLAMKYLGGVVVLFLGLSIIVSKFSETVTIYDCTGTYTLHEVSLPQVFSLRLHDYRWWVGLWSDTDGMAWVEMPNSGPWLYLDGEESSIAWYFRDSTYFGSFSTISRTARFSSVRGALEGSCVPQV